MILLLFFSAAKSLELARSDLLNFFQSDSFFRLLLWYIRNFSNSFSKLVQRYYNKFIFYLFQFLIYIALYWSPNFLVFIITWARDLSCDRASTFRYHPCTPVFWGSLITPIILGTYLRVQCLLGSLSTKELRILAIKCSGWRPFLRTLLLFYHPIDSSIALGVSQGCGSRDEKSSGTVFPTRLILTGQLKAMIFLARWDIRKITFC